MDSYATCGSYKQICRRRTLECQRPQPKNCQKQQNPAFSITRIYNIVNGVLIEKYRNLKNGSSAPNPQAPASMLFDIDGDGDFELIYCGRGDTNNDVISAYDFNGTHPILLCEYNITST